MFASKDIFLKSSGGYQISRSVRIRQSASAYFNRTFATPTSNQKMTLSCWVKIGSTSQTAGQLTLLNGGNGTQVNASNSFIQLRSDGTALKLQILCNGGGAATVGGYRTFAPYFRDNSAWYHIVLAADTTQATAANRYRGYINGVEITSYTGVDPNQNVSITWLNTAVEHLIGKNNEGGGPVYSDTYITEMYWIDGQQLTPSSFGETNSVTGVWQPKKYGGTYGTNGFYLNFSDNSNNTATTIGKDYSGNGNNWTPNNISVTAGVTYDSMLDVPTLYADGGNGRGNYCVLNPLSNLIGGNYPTMSNGNLSAAGAGNPTHIWGTFGIAAGDTTSWYWEGVCTSLDAVRTYMGIIDPTTTTSAPGASYAFVDKAILSSTGAYFNTASGTAGGSAGTYTSYAVNDVVMVAYQNGKIWFGKNGTWMNSGNPAAGTGAIDTAVSTARTWIPYFGYNSSWTANFGQRPFTYTPPTGFVALNTQNLPDSTIKKGSLYFDAKTYSGTGGTQSISNTSGFATDLAWIKMRSAVGENYVWDTVRGGGSALDLVTNRTNAEGFNSAYHNFAFTSTGFDITQIGIGNEVNASGQTYVAWQWNAGGSTVTNTSGTISAQVRANATAGFSVVTMTYSSVAGTVGHGLGVAPKMIIVKRRDSAGSWYVAHSGLTNMSGYYLLLESTAAQGAASWGGSPTSTVFYMSNSIFASGNYVAYCFAAVAGYSAFGSYTGNGSTDGPFIYTGFRPRFVMFKRTDSGGNWTIFDTSRDTYNVEQNALFPSLSNAETVGACMDILSNGFKYRNTGLDYNASGGTYIFMAVAENPFKLSLAR